MPAGTFSRVIFKGPRDDRGLFLSIVDDVEKRHGPITGDGSTVKRIRTTSGPVYVRITKRSISVQREPFGETVAQSKGKQNG